MELKIVASNNTYPLPKTEAPAPVVDIARVVSHDLGNVLSRMNGYLEELREYCGTDGLSLIDEVMEASSEIEQLTKQLSQIGRSQQDDASKPINMGQLFAQQAGFVGNLYPDIKINLNVDTLSTAVGHEDKMKRVVQNLLVNACDAIPESGTIEWVQKKSMKVPSIAGFQTMVTGCLKQYKIKFSIVISRPKVTMARVLGWQTSSKS